MSEPMGPCIGDRYVVSDERAGRFAADGYVHLPGVSTDDEVDAHRGRLRHVHARRDRCAGQGPERHGDGGVRTDPSHYAIFNVMLPRRYHPAWQDNIFERVGLSIAEQLCGEGMVLDFDQLLAKQPGRERRGVRVASGSGVLDQHRRPPHRDVLARRRRLHYARTGACSFFPGAIASRFDPTAHSPAAVKTSTRW